MILSCYRRTEQMYTIINRLFLLLPFFSCNVFPREVKSCPRFSKNSQPKSELYLVQPSPVQFIIEPQDLVFFHGDTISLHCETNCIQLQMNTTCAVGFLHNGLDLDYYEPPYESTLSSQRETGRRTLTIHNAHKAVSGRYQCFTNSPRFGRLPLTDRIIGKPIQLQMAAIEPVSGKMQKMSVPEGGNLELPCIQGVFPNPSNISWRRIKDQSTYDSVKSMDSAEITSNGNLVLTNVSSHMSGNYCCEIGWKNHKPFSATYQIFIDDSIKTSTEIIKPSLQLESPNIVALNASIDYISEGTSIYYKSDLLVDLKNVDDYLINVTVSCTFSGHPKPKVKWLLNGLNVSGCMEETNIVTVGNTSLLQITTTNPKSFFGSYQCVVDNEIGYASNTTRILPKGWSNPPRILSVTFHNTNITLKWQSPEYTGGEIVQYYRVGFQNLYQRTRHDKMYLEHQTSLHSYTFGDIKRYTVDGKFYVQFTIEVMSANAVPISDVSSVKLDSYPNDIYPEINDVDCRGRNVTVKWTNHNQTVYSKIWDYCVFFNCTTPRGTVTDKTCVPALRRSHLKIQQKLIVDNVPNNGTCSFKVLVFTDGYIYRWSNYKMCTRNLSSEKPRLILKKKKKFHTLSNKQATMN